MDEIWVLASKQQLTCRWEKGALGYRNKAVIIRERHEFMNRGKDLTPFLSPHPTPALKNNRQVMAHR